MKPFQTKENFGQSLAFSVLNFTQKLRFYSNCENNIDFFLTKYTSN